MQIHSSNRTAPRQLPASSPPPASEPVSRDEWGPYYRGTFEPVSWWSQSAANNRMTNAEYVMTKSFTVGTTAFAATVGYLHAGVPGALVGGGLGLALVGLEYSQNG